MPDGPRSGSKRSRPLLSQSSGASAGVLKGIDGSLPFFLSFFHILKSCCIISSCIYYNSILTFYHFSASSHLPLSLYFSSPGWVHCFLSLKSSLVPGFAGMEMNEVKHGSRWAFFWGAALHGMRDLSSLTREQTPGPAVKVLSPNHWTGREFPR